MATASGDRRERNWVFMKLGADDYANGNSQVFYYLGRQADEKMFKRLTSSVRVTIEQDANKQYTIAEDHATEEKIELLVIGERHINDPVTLSDVLD